MLTGGQQGTTRTMLSQRGISRPMRLLLVTADSLDQDNQRNSSKPVCNNPTRKPKTPPRLTIACNSLFTIP